MNQITWRNGLLSALAIVAIMISSAARAEEGKETAQQPVHFFALTEENLASYEAATANLEKVAAALRATPPPEEEGENDGSTEAVIGALTAGCEKTEPFRTAVAGAKLSCRDYAVMNITLMQAGILSLGYKDGGVKFLERMPGGATGHVRANIEFVMARKERIDTVTAKQMRVFSPE